MTFRQLLPLVNEQFVKEGFTTINGSALRKYRLEIAREANPDHAKPSHMEYTKDVYKEQTAIISQVLTENDDGTKFIALLPIVNQRLSDAGIPLIQMKQLQERAPRLRKELKLTRRELKMGRWEKPLREFVRETFEANPKLKLSRFHEIVSDQFKDSGIDIPELEALSKWRRRTLRGK